MKEWTCSLERTIVICAQRSTVFRYFVDSARFADWWGAGSSIEGKPGGKVRICNPNAVLAGGEVLEITEGERVVFTYGYESGHPIPLGTSRVTITLKDHPEGTELRLFHEFTDESVRDLHIGGWRYHLAVFSNVACNEQHQGYVQLIDEYFRIWSTADGSARSQVLQRIASPDVRFRDAFGCVAGRDELNAHIGAAQQHMPGITLEREGQPVQCQGTAMSRWIARKSDGAEAARGTNMFHFTPETRIHSIVGFWMPSQG